VKSLRDSLRITGIVAAAALLGLVACAPEKPVPSRASVKDVSRRQAAPDFTLKDASGKLVHLADYKGKVVLLDFWATWCGPCKIEIPWLKDFQRQYRDKGFEVIGISMDEEGWQVVKPFVSEVGINYRIVIGDDSTAQLYGGVDALPTAFVIDREGRIAAVHVGLTSKGEIQHGIEEVLASTPVSAQLTGTN
jgi:cytochrome c biogenesis protein CcmG/thiol:disulfide interchange protein DsbE